MNFSGDFIARTLPVIKLGQQAAQQQTQQAVQPRAAAIPQATIQKTTRNPVASQGASNRLTRQELMAAHEARVAKSTKGGS